MIARFTTTGMQLIPYKPKICRPILLSRSSYMPSIHRMQEVTAHVVADNDGKRLCTYHSNKEWLQANCPGYEIEVMPPNHVLPIGELFHINDDVIPNEVQASGVQSVLDNDFKTAFFNVPTGAGKTLMAIYLTSILNVKGWAMCYRLIVLEQWVSTLKKMTNFNIDRVRVVSSSAELYKMATGNYDPDRFDLYLSTPMLLVKFAETHGMDLLNDAMDFCGIGVKFFDEAHKNVGNICKINALTNIARTYYLSADFGQPTPERQQLYYKMFARVPVIRPVASLVEKKKYTVAVVIHYDTHPTLLQVESSFTKYGFNHMLYMDYQMQTKEFYEAITNVLKSIRESDIKMNHRYRTIILCKLINHVERLQEFVRETLKDIYQDEEPPYVVRFHSQMPDEEREDALQNGEIIVSTYQSMGVGVDLKNVRYVVSLCPVNIIDDNQAAGRARALPNGEDCFYFMFTDDGYEYVRKKLPSRLGYLTQQKVKQVYSIKYS